MQNTVGYMLFPPKEKEVGFLKVGSRDRLLLNQCPVHGHLGLSKVKVGHCRNSGGIFLHQASNIRGKLPHVAVKLAHVYLGFFPPSLKKFAKYMKRKA